MEISTDKKLPEEVELFLKELKEAYEEIKGCVLIEHRSELISSENYEQQTIVFELVFSTGKEMVFQIGYQISRTSGSVLTIYSTNGFILSNLVNLKDLKYLHMRKEKITEVLREFIRHLKRRQENALIDYRRNQDLLERISIRVG